MQPGSGDGVNFSEAATGDLFSEISITNKTIRGPIRQGIDMSANNGVWYVRGFFRNMGATSGALNYNLTYNVSLWEVYSIDPATAAPYSTANQTGAFNQTPGTTDMIIPSDDRIYTTDDSRSSNITMWNTSSSTKPYIAAAFTWSVVWNSSGNEANLTNINTTMSMPTLYMVDLTGILSSTGTVSPDVGNEDVTITAELENDGHTDTNPEYAQLLSYVPNNTTGGYFRGSGWVISSPTIYLNETFQIDNDTTNCVLTYTQPTESSNGSVSLTVTDLSACDLTAGGTVGTHMDTGENITVTYTVSSDNAMTTGDSYTFWGIGQLNTTDDTENREYFTETSVDVSGKRLIGYKDLIAYNVNIPTLINTTIKIEVQDQSGTGIDGIIFKDYIPDGIATYTQYRGNVTLFHYDGGSENMLVLGTSYEIADNGTVTLPDGLQAHAFEIINRSGGVNGTWNLTNGQYLRLSYNLNYSTAGSYLLPTTIAAFDPDTGASLGTTFYGQIRVILPESNVPLVIEEGELTQSKTVLVGRPAVWNKEFDVFNPNPSTVSASFETEVFPDANDGYVTYFDENGRRVEEGITFKSGPGGSRLLSWQSILSPLENRNYEVTVLTPPVLEIDRDIEVMEQLPNKKVRLKMDVYLKSFAKTDYQNVILNLPISYENVEEVRDGFGERLAFTGGLDTVSVTVDRMAADELKTITIIYQESYPTIIITPDRDRYNLNAPVSLEILVINGGETIEYPFLEIEIYTPGMDVVFSDIKSLASMDPLEKTEMYEKFVIPASAPAGMYIASARFREDFAVLASTTGNFYVMGVSGGLPAALEIFMIIIVAGILVFFSYRRLREVRGPRKYGGI